MNFDFAMDETYHVFRLVKIIVYEDRKSTRLNSSHANTSYAVFCLKKKTTFDAYLPLSSLCLPPPLPLPDTAPLSLPLLLLLLASFPFFYYPHTSPPPLSLPHPLLS